eukprot:6134774-Pyramimonas_sp.AAC.1
MDQSDAPLPGVAQREQERAVVRKLGTGEGRRARRLAAEAGREADHHQIEGGGVRSDDGGAHHVVRVRGQVEVLMVLEDLVRHPAH